jgi:endonuclease/exonuclease/phosphatase (EEP) superfamily protein YafD
VTSRATPSAGLHRTIRIGAFVLALAATLGVLPVMVARLLGGGPPQPWPQLTALAPVATAVAAVAFGSALVVRAHWVAVVPGVIFATLASWLLAPPLAGRWHDRFGSAPTAVAASRTVRGEDDVRVLTANAEYGRADAAALVAQVRHRQVDILTVQELTPDLVTRLDAAGLGRELPFHALRPETGFSGTGIWSRWALTPLDDVRGTHSATPRAVVRPPAGPALTVIAVHPIAPAGHNAERTWREDLRQVRAAILEAMGGSRTTPVVVAGDFNATRDHALFRDLLAPGLEDALDSAPNPPWLGFTFPAGRRYPPIMRLDHVLHTAPGLTCLSAATITVPGTDHRAVVATLRPSSFRHPSQRADGRSEPLRYTADPL